MVAGWAGQSSWGPGFASRVTGIWSCLAGSALSDGAGAGSAAARYATRFARSPSTSATRSNGVATATIRWWPDGDRHAERKALDKISRLIVETVDGRETGGPLLGYERNGTIVIDVGGPDLLR
jgi:hypothetical protein